MRILDANHADYLVAAIFVQRDTTYTGCRTSHYAHCAFVEADGTTVTVSNHDFVVTIGHTYFDHLVVFADGNCIHTVLARTRILFQYCLLDDTILRAEQYVVAVDEFLIVQVLHTQVCSYRIVRLDVEQVLDGTSLRCLVAFRNFVHLQPVALTFLGKEQHGVVHCSRIDVLDEVFIACFTTLRAYSTTVLCAEISQRRTFDVSQMRNGDNHLIVSIEVFRIEVFRSVYDFRTALVTVLLFHLEQLILDNLLAKLVVHQNFLEVSNLLHQFLIFVVQLVLHQSGKLSQTHFNDSSGLNFSQFEASHQVVHRLVRSLGSTDDTDNFVDIV